MKLLKNIHQITFTALTLFFFSAVGNGLAATDPDTPAPEPKLKGKELVSALQQGGYILYFRHGITDHTTYDIDHNNLQNCQTQRMLSQEGKKQMQHIGDVIKKLGIPISIIYSSPYCRSIDTVKLAFGEEITLKEDLRHTVIADEQTAIQRAKALNAMLATQPTSGTNNVISGHTANLQEATGIWPKPEGVAVVFRPKSDGSFEFISTIEPTAWDKLLSLTAD